MGAITDADGNVAQISIAGDLSVSDDFKGGEVLADQPGANGVLTFTFAQPCNLVLIQAVGTGTARADPFGGTPTASQGIRCDDSVPTYLPVTTNQVKVYTPTGMTVSVAGFKRS